MSSPLKTITNALGYQQITSLSTVAGLTLPTKNANGSSVSPVLAVIIAEAQAVRWRDDGVDPTASVGMPLAAGATLEYDGDLARIRFIEQATGAKLNVSYYI